jgi:hypothetical protein
MASKSEQRMRAAFAALEAAREPATLPDARAIWRRGRFLSGHGSGGRRDLHGLPIAETLVAIGALGQLASAHSLTWFIWGLALTTGVGAAVALGIGLRLSRMAR